MSYAEAAGSRIRRGQPQLAAGLEPLVVEPVEEIAVVLREPDDGRGLPLFELRQRLQLVVFGLLERGIDRPAVGAALGMPSFRAIRSTMSSENESPISSAWMCASAGV